jgi:hypothetical protein
MPCRALLGVIEWKIRLVVVAVLRVAERSACGSGAAHVCGGGKLRSRSSRMQGDCERNRGGSRDGVS